MMAQYFRLIILCSIVLRFQASMVAGRNVDEIRKRFLFEKDPEIKMTASQIIQHHGYPVVDYYVTTKDGYILNLQRIPYGRNGKSERNGTPVLLQHGLLDSSVTWVMNLPKQSLAFILADAGYDVWLGNSRGNTYSKGHIILDVDSKKFWDFSFEEMAKYDLPAFVNFILQTTRTEQIHYVGHSQGTMIGFVEFSRNKELREKIKSFTALAPVTHINGVKGAMRAISKVSGLFTVFSKLVGVKEFAPNHAITSLLARIVCKNQGGSLLCSNVAFMIMGFNRKNLNNTRIPVYVSHAPAGSSAKNLIHYAQMARRRRFRQYDYGFIRNRFIYNQILPPNYNISNIDIPVALFVGDKDWLAPPRNVRRYIRPQLKNIIYDQTIPSYNHIDFVWGVDAYSKVYQNILNVFSMTEKK